MIQAFKTWGMPKSVRFDNGKPLGDPQRKSLSELAVWLLSLGIIVIHNRPRQPTDNAKVERMQQTTKNWSNLEDCQDFEDLQQRLSYVLEVQRSKYRVSRLGRKTRMEVFPEISTNPRSYSSDLFDPQLAYEQLSKWTFVRKVSKHGQFSMFKGIYYLGTEYKRQYVSVQLCPKTINWKVFDANGKYIKAYSAQNLTAENIWNLTIYQKTFSNKN
ncbi:MAG TPA: hypothetical protein V6C96_04020 [Vampirovibrionales bacterium]